MQPLIKWPGGKRWALKHILPLIPPHETYCEVFAGGLAVLLAKPPSPIEIANDLNGELVALYRCIQFHPAELKRELSHHQTGRQNVLDYARQPGLTDIQKAARFLLLNRASFGAGHHSYAPPKTGGGGEFSWRQASQITSAFRNRLRDVHIENLPYERCLELYDSPTTVFFLDPPYVCPMQKPYPGWNEGDLQELRDHLSGLRARWILTIADSPFARKLFKACQIRPLSKHNNRGSIRGKLQAELLITP